MAAKELIRRALQVLWFQAHPGEECSQAGEKAQWKRRPVPARSGPAGGAGAPPAARNSCRVSEGAGEAQLGRSAAAAVPQGWLRRKSL